ncbi:MAG TPA: DNA primase, partial [Halieaceae bacterium]|nr:DNA primase [Halieaceae bacterium]
TATSQTHLERLYRLTPEVVFCFDGDAAGRKAALRALETVLPCMEDGRQARFLFLDEGEDPDTLVRKLGSEAFRELVKRATPLEAFLFDAVSEGLDTVTLEGRARLSKLALPWLRQLPDGVFRQLMFRALAERTGLTVAELMHLEAPPPPASAPPQEPPPGGETGNRGPRQRSPTSPAPLGYSNLAQAAIALL